jgi:hypothetical protein
VAVGARYTIFRVAGWKGQDDLYIATIRITGSTGNTLQGVLVPGMTAVSPQPGDRAVELRPDR